MSTTKKYFWLKLKKDFFKRHDIRIIESMENGKDYILFYMKLLVESVSHDGNLRFSSEIPYDEKMLSVITNTNIDIVRSAVKIFTELKMMETLDDGTIFLQEVEKMTGYETSDAIRMRQIRAEKKQKMIEGEQCSKPFKNRSPELEKELETDKEIEIDNKFISVSQIDHVKDTSTKPEICKYLEHYYNCYNKYYGITARPKDKDYKTIKELREIIKDDYTYFVKLVHSFFSDEYWFNRKDGTPVHHLGSMKSNIGEIIAKTNTMIGASKRAETTKNTRKQLKEEAEIALAEYDPELKINIPKPIKAQGE